MIGKCTEDLTKEGCISVWDAISYLYAGLDNWKVPKGPGSHSVLDGKFSAGELRNSETSVQSTFTQISQSFQDLVNFTKAFSDKQAVLSQCSSAPPSMDSSLLELRRDLQALTV
jgi:hypothetical protein